MGSSAPTTTAPTTDEIERGTPAQRVLIFALDGRSYGCGIELVREIIPFRRPTRLPGAPAAVLGIVNLRGTILTVIDLARHLFPSAPMRTEGSIILVDHGAKVAGIAVDEVMDVQPIPADRIEAGAPGDLDVVAAAEGVVVGLGHLDDERVAVLLDMQRIVQHVLL